MKIDNGNNTVSTDGGDDNRSKMLASAQAIAASTVRFEGNVSKTAKAWGHALFVAVYTDGLNLDALIGDSKIAAGWKTLTASEGGRKAKQRLEVYFSNARLVAERWTTALDDDQRSAVLGGTASIHYLADQMRKADRDAKKAEAAAAAAEKAAEAADDSATIVAVPDGLTLAVLAEAMLNRYQLADDAEKAEAHAALELLVDAMNADIEAAAEVLKKAA
jgi:hypothetical protein